MEEQLQTTEAKNELSKLGLKDLFFKYIRFLPLFIVSIALSLIAAYTYLRYTTPIYQSTGSLIIREENKGTSDKLNELISADNEVNIQNEIELLKSRPIMERVIDALDLNFSYYAKGKVRETNIYKAVPFVLEVFALEDSATTFSLNIQFANPHSFSINGEEKLISFNQAFKNRDGVFKLIKKEGVIGEEYVIKYDPANLLVKELLDNLLIVPKGNTNILLLSMEATNPQLAADVVNRLMEEYRQYSVEEKIESITQQLTFINSRLGVVDDELDSVTSNLNRYRKANNLIDFEAQSSDLFVQIREADKQSNEMQAQLAIVDLIESNLLNNRNNFNTTPSALSIPDPTLNNLIAAYNVIQLERKALSDKNVPVGNPLIQEKGEAIEKLRQKILQNLNTIRTSYSTSLTDMRNEGGAAQSKVRALPEKQQRLLEIVRQQETKQRVYDILLEQKERSSISLAATTSNIKVVDTARPNSIAIKPNRWNVQSIAIFIGLILPALFIFLLEILNDKITTRNDIERLTDATILGEVGHSDSNDALVVKSNNRSVVAEQFRIIRSNLQYVIHAIKKPVILVTSSFSGEGKSFISTNIGAVMALAGKRTVILEFDIRKPKILSHLNLAKRPGLTNYLLGKAPLEGLAVAVPGNENLFVLACGPIPPNPSEMLLDPKLTDLFDYLRSNFDMVIMDTAPVGMVSDALTLSKFADATLYIARQGHTYKKQVGLIDEFYRQGKLPKISLILNDIKLRSGYGYYGYGRYGYGYGTGYFDDEEMPPPTLLHRWFGWLDITRWTKRKKKAKA